MDFLKVKNNFNFDFYTRRKIYSCYRNIYNLTTGEGYLNNTEEIQGYSKKDILVINNIPSYLDARITENNGFYRLFKIHYLDGFLIDLQGFVSLETFMRTQFSSKSRSKLRSFIRHLETCFDIRYKMYYGAIAKKEFHFLMDALRVMISRRFLQRGDIHESVKKWDYYQSSAYDMILQKKASLFVIYNGQRPIDICLNYHHQNILFGKIKSYDIDYSKFRLGSIDTLKLLEWCLGNNHTVLDLSHGNLAYKHAWCNSVYVFEHHVLYNYKKLNCYLTAYLMFCMLKLKAFLKKRKIDVFYHKIKGRIKQGRIRKQLSREKKIAFEAISTNSFDEMSIYPIDPNNVEFAFLRKTIHDFQYLNFEHSRDIEVYKFLDDPNKFIVKGQKNRALFTLPEKSLMK